MPSNPANFKLNEILRQDALSEVISEVLFSYVMISNLLRTLSNCWHEIGVISLNNTTWYFLNCWSNPWLEIPWTTLIRLNIGDDMPAQILLFRMITDGIPEYVPAFRMVLCFGVCRLQPYNSTFFTSTGAITIPLCQQSNPDEYWKIDHKNNHPIGDIMAGGFPSIRVSNSENVSVLWRHHYTCKGVHILRNYFIDQLARLNPLAWFVITTCMIDYVVELTFNNKVPSSAMSHRLGRPAT